MRVLLLFALPRCAAELLTVRFGYFNEAGPYAVGCARGWFSNPAAGWEVACLFHDSGNDIASRIDEGDLDISQIGSSPLAKAVARGVDLVAVYLALFHGSSTALVVRNTKAQMVTELDDNVTVATLKGTGGQFLLDRTRELFALDCEVDYPHSDGDIIKEYDDGTIDGAFIWGPTRLHILANGGTSLVTSSQLNGLAWAGKNGLFNELVAAGPFARARPDIVRHVVAVIAAIEASYLAEDAHWDVARRAGFEASIADLLNPGVNTSRAAERENARALLEV